MLNPFSSLIEGKEVSEEYCTFLPKPEHKTKVKEGGILEPKLFSLPCHIKAFMSSGSHEPRTVRFSMPQLFCLFENRNLYALNSPFRKIMWYGRTNCCDLRVPLDKKANMWHGRRKVVAHGRLPSTACIKRHLL